MVSVDGAGSGASGNKGQFHHRRRRPFASLAIAVGLFALLLLQSSGAEVCARLAVSAGCLRSGSFSATSCGETAAETVMSAGAAAASPTMTATRSCPWAWWATSDVDGGAARGRTSRRACSVMFSTVCREWRSA